MEYNKHVQEMIKEWEEIAKNLMVLTQEQREMYNDESVRRQQSCYFCHKQFDADSTIVRHHEHVPPFNFLGLAHQAPCNILASAPRDLVVAFHNFTGYDGKFILQAASQIPDIKIEVVPNTSEKFMSMKLNKHIKFIDTLRFFMGASLEKLVKDMDKSTDFSITRQRLQNRVNDQFGNLSDDKLDLLLQKNIYTIHI